MTETKALGIKNIIFDLGGVLLNINPLLSLDEFAKISGISQAELRNRLQQEKIFEKFDTGSISPAEFRSGLCRILDKQINDVEIDRAWNKLLLDFPSHRVHLLQELKKNYRIFLLSNTNIIHFWHYTHEFSERHGVQMTDLFDKLFLSFEIGMHKPDADIYDFVIQNACLNTSECIFIDDSFANIEAAEVLGITGIHITGNRDVTSYFENGILKNSNPD
jgi:putative hydrolase of the HAD superfamily